MLDIFDDDYNLTLKRQANAQAALDKVMAMVEAEMDGSKAAGPLVGMEIIIKGLEYPHGDAEGHVEIELEQPDYLYIQETLTIARLALDDLLAHLVNSQGGGHWVVDWPTL